MVQREEERMQARQHAAIYKSESGSTRVCLRCKRYGICLRHRPCKVCGPKFRCRSEADKEHIDRTADHICTADEGAVPA